MIYLDNAATSFPKAPGVAEEVYEYLTKYGVSSGRSSYPAAVRVSRKIFDCRQNIATIFNIPDPSRIAFTLNATTSLNAALKGLIKEGSTIITSALEHNAVTRPLNYLKKTRNINIINLQSDSEGYISSEDLKEKISQKPALLLINHASNVTGIIQDLKSIGEICKKYGVPLMVDAAQSAGATEINVRDMNISILAASGHKSLLGPAGTGFLYARQELEFPPLIQGGTGSSSEQSIQPEFWPDKMESGTLNIGAIIGLKTSTDFILEQTTKKIIQKKGLITAYLKEKLSNLPEIVLYGPAAEKPLTGAVSFNLKGKKPSEIAALLNSHNICVRTGLHCAPEAHKFLKTWPEGTVRVSPGYFTKEEEIDKLIKILKTAM